MTLLLTGYEPFGDHDRNPSARLARDLDGESIAGREVVGRVLPVEFGTAGDRTRDLIEELDPAVVVATGLAAGRAAVCLERVGLNVRDCAGVPDNADAAPRDDPVDPEGAAAHLATLPVVAVVESLLDRGIPARASNTAGTHLCNELLYETRAHLDATDRETPAGFVHLPRTPESAAAVAADAEAAAGGEVSPSLPLSLQRRALVATFEATLDRATAA